MIVLFANSHGQPHASLFHVGPEKSKSSNRAWSFKHLACEQPRKSYLDKKFEHTFCSTKP